MALRYVAAYAAIYLQFFDHAAAKRAGALAVSAARKRSARRAALRGHI